MCFQCLMLRTWKYNRNTDSKEPTDACVCREEGGADLQIINSQKILIKLLLKQFRVITAIEC